MDFSTPDKHRDTGNPYRRRKFCFARDAFFLLVGASLSFYPMMCIIGEWLVKDFCFLYPAILIYILFFSSHFDSSSEPLCPVGSAKRPICVESAPSPTLAQFSGASVEVAVASQPERSGPTLLGVFAGLGPVTRPFLTAPRVVPSGPAPVVSAPAPVVSAPAPVVSAPAPVVSAPPATAAPPATVPLVSVPAAAGSVPVTPVAPLGPMVPLASPFGAPLPAEAAVMATPPVPPVCPFVVPPASARPTAPTPVSSSALLTPASAPPSSGSVEFLRESTPVYQGDGSDDASESGEVPSEGQGESAPDVLTPAQYFALRSSGVFTPDPAPLPPATVPPFLAGAGPAPPVLAGPRGVLVPPGAPVLGAPPGTPLEVMIRTLQEEVAALKAAQAAHAAAAATAAATVPVGVVAAPGRLPNTDVSYKNFTRDGVPEDRSGLAPFVPRFPLSALIDLSEFGADASAFLGGVQPEAVTYARQQFLPCIKPDLLSELPEDFAERDRTTALANMLRLPCPTGFPKGAPLLPPQDCVRA
ncbi:hypothetical protein PAPYR_11031 [Paratrimastix pyriformis]|uniref:Uncharacterized protein n=1 Tax=Paratrimastix pyriformis TaxID=342808 RepID=A0ABQ8U4M9_9EUKA|nr:hypothetical protein PAPYR_11031 [Paratrimastix pyriformis]